MDILKQNMLQFFDRWSVFKIPVFQRNYNWTFDNCNQLFFDIKNILDTGREHFIGTIVYKKFEEGIVPSFSIIDGQQRITTLQLLVKAMYDIEYNVINKKVLKNKVLENEYASIDKKFKLVPIAFDFDIYNKIMNMESFDENLFNLDEKNTIIYKNYIYLKQKLIENKITSDNIIFALTKLISVIIFLENESPQEIFESLNSTGLSLSNADLLRNYLLMSLDYEKQKELYNNYWLKMERMLGSDKIELYLIHYLIFKRKTDSITFSSKKSKINDSNLYISFKKYIEENKIDFKYLFEDMYKYSKYYKRFIFCDIKSKNKIDKKLYDIFYTFNTSSAAVLLLEYFDMFNNNEIIESDLLSILDICISYIFRVKICINKSVSNQFFAFVLARINGKEDIVKQTWEAFNKGKGRYAFPNDNEFKNCLINKNLYQTLKSVGCRYLLFNIEKYENKEVPPIDEASIEHVMPQNLNSKWESYLNDFDDLDSREKLLHTLGNLTLSHSSINSELSDNLFNDKKEIYGKSNYTFTRKLKDYINWTSAEILDRANELANIAVNIWALPSKYNISKISSSDFHYFSENHTDFDGSKPCLLVINDKEYNVKYWKNVLESIVRFLYKEYPEIIKECRDIKINNWISELTKNPINENIKIDEDIYLYTGTSTSRKLGFISNLIEYIEQKENISIMDDFSFKIL